MTGKRAPRTPKRIPRYIVGSDAAARAYLESRWTPAELRLIYSNPVTRREMRVTKSAPRWRRLSIQSYLRAARAANGLLKAVHHLHAVRATRGPYSPQGAVVGPLALERQLEQVLEPLTAWWRGMGEAALEPWPPAARAEEELLFAYLIILKLRTYVSQRRLLRKPGPRDLMALAVVFGIQKPTTVEHLTAGRYEQWKKAWQRAQSMFAATYGRDAWE